MDRLQGKVCDSNRRGRAHGRAIAQAAMRAKAHAWECWTTMRNCWSRPSGGRRQARSPWPAMWPTAPRVCCSAIGGYAERMGGLDVLVNNAAYFHYAPLTEMPEDVVDRMIDVGLKGALWSLQAATPHLIARGGGAVINLSSVAVSIAIKHAAVYSAIKGALDTLTRQQSGGTGAHGIRVNALAPGPVITPAPARSSMRRAGKLDARKRR